MKVTNCGKYVHLLMTQDEARGLEIASDSTQPAKNNYFLRDLAYMLRSQRMFEARTPSASHTDKVLREYAARQLNAMYTEVTRARALAPEDVHLQRLQTALTPWKDTYRGAAAPENSEAVLLEFIQRPAQADETQPQTQTAAVTTAQPTVRVNTTVDPTPYQPLHMPEREEDDDWTF